MVMEEIVRPLGSYVGSLARFKKRQTFSILPFSSKSCLKNRAVSMFTCNRVREGWRVGGRKEGRFVCGGIFLSLCNDITLH